MAESRRRKLWGCIVKGRVGLYYILSKFSLSSGRCAHSWPPLLARWDLTSQGRGWWSSALRRPPCGSSARRFTPVTWVNLNSRSDWKIIHLWEVTVEISADSHCSSDALGEEESHRFASSCWGKEEVYRRRWGPTSTLPVGCASRRASWKFSPWAILMVSLILIATSTLPSTSLHKLTAYLSLVVYDSEEVEIGCGEECILAGHCQCSKCK